MFDAIKQTAKGAKIIREWFGAGGEPVDLDLAEARADICRDCPENVKGGWMERLKADAAQTIKEHLTVKNGVGLEVPDEHEIGFCKQCGCALQLKVWCPLEHIRSHTSEDEVLEFPSFCWVRKESNL